MAGLQHWMASRGNQRERPQLGALGLNQQCVSVPCASFKFREGVCRGEFTLTYVYVRVNKYLLKQNTQSLQGAER